MSDPHRWKCDCEFLNPDWTADKIEVVRASDYDALSTQLREARELLRWAIEFVTTETIDLANCHRDPASGAIEPRDVAVEVSNARDWIARARRVCS